MMNTTQAKSGGKPIIDDAAMLRIKQYIERKHPDFTSSQRAALFANAVHRIIDRQLPDFEEQTKVKLRRELLSRMGLDQRFTLLPRHILEACEKLDLEESGVAQFALWMEKRQLTSLEGSEAAGQQEKRAFKKLFATYRRSMLALGIGISLLALALTFIFPLYGESPSSKPILTDTSQTEHAVPLPDLSSVLPSGYNYHALNEDKLRSWLQAKQSLLAEEPYFTAILAAAENNDIHPLLLFAITGQEQAYVPKNAKQARQIANNPFNVHNSWKTYNTNIEDSARIASKTIISISQTRPDDAHPIMWLNTKYAEDPNWWMGVTSIFEKMRREIEQD